MNSAFYVASALTLAAGLVAWFGLAGVRAPWSAPDCAPMPVEA